MKAYAVAITLLLVIFGSIGGYLYKRFSAFASTDFAPPPVTIAASVAILETWSETLNAVGTIQSVRGVELTSEGSGEIIEIRFASGDHVSAGQTLVVLNNKEELASRRNQAAAVELAELLFDRDRSLIERHSIPQTQFDRSRADLERARAQLAETEARIANKRIEAPFSGTIGIKKVDVGDYLSPGTVIATLQDQSELEIDFTVPARYRAAVARGSARGRACRRLSGPHVCAVVAAVDARIDPNTRNVLMRALLEKDSGLLPGMFAELDVDLGERQPGGHHPGDGDDVLAAGQHRVRDRADARWRADGQRAGRARRQGARQSGCGARRRESRRKGRERRAEQAPSWRARRRRRECGAMNPRFTDLFVRRPVLSLVLSALMLLVGIQAGTQLSLRQYPEVEKSVIFVNTFYPGASAETVQGFVTTPLQRRIAAAKGVEFVVSQSDPGLSQIEANVRLGEDSTEVLAEIISKVNEARHELPRDVEDPVVSNRTGGDALMYLALALR